MLAGRERMANVTAVCLANTHSVTGLMLALIALRGHIPMLLQRAVWIVQQASTWQITGPTASGVLKTHTLCLGVLASRTVCATLAGQERTVTALDVCLANTHPVTGLMLALIALRGHIPMLLQQAVWIVQQASTLQITGPTASGVLKTHTLFLGVVTSRTVCATLAGQERMVTAQDVCLASTKPPLALMRAWIVELENIQFP